MKKILFVINTLGTAGAEKALLELLSRINRDEFEVDLFVLMNQGELVKDVPSNVHILNRNIDTTPVQSKEGYEHLKKYVFRQFFKHGAVFSNFAYLVKHTVSMVLHGKINKDKLLWYTMATAGERFKTEYDLAVAYIEGGAAYYTNRYVKAKKKAAFIHIDYKEAGYSRSLDRDCYLNFDRIYAVSDEVKKVFTSVYPEMSEKTDVFHNLLNIDRIREKAKADGGFADGYNGIRLLTVGRLTSQKAFEVSIKALRLLKDRGVTARWYVLGEGDERTKLEAYINELSLTEDFILLGNRENPYPYYKQCDIYVHASKFEGKSIAIQEAKILGCPIVVSDCSGNREQVTDGVDGKMCDFDSEKIADAIFELIKDESKRTTLGENAAKSMEAMNSDESIKNLLNLTKM